MSDRPIDQKKSVERTNILKRLFRVGYNKDATKPSDALFGTKEIKKDGKTYIQKDALHPKVEQLFNYWLTQCHDSADSFLNRELLYKDMDMLYFNSPLIARALHLRRDECLQSDSTTSILGVIAEPKQKEFILKFIEDTNLEALLPDTELNILQYGDAGWVLSLDESGVTEIVPIDPYDLIDRIEFTPKEVRKYLQQKNSSISKLSSIERIKELLKSIDNPDEYMSYFKNYLFGFQIGDFLLPPWRFIHFRNFTTKSPFTPFGVPAYIHSVAPYRQFDAAMGLQIAARGASIPIDNYTINMGAGMNPTDKLDKVLEFINEFDNSGMRDTKKEGIGVGERMISIKDLFEYNQIAPQIDLGKLDDIELLRDEIILSTEVPRYLLDPNANAWGTGGAPLIQQWKPFARLIYHDQTNLLSGISQVIKIHMLQSGKFAYNEIDFQLTMPFPESQTDRDLIGSQNDLWALSSNILDTLADKIAGGTALDLPDEIKKQVYSQILPYNSDRINKWINFIKKDKEEKEAEAERERQEAERQNQMNQTNMNGQQPQQFNKPQNRPQQNVFERLSKRTIKEAIDESIFEVTQNTLREGVMNDRHFYSSRKNNTDFDIQFLEKCQINKANKTRLEEVKVSKGKMKNGKRR